MIDPVYDADGITLYFGECEVVMPMLTCIVDAVMADLPYATTKNDWDKPIDAKTLWHCYRGLMGERSPVLLFGSGMFTAEMMLSNREAWKYNLVWDKKAITGQLNAKRQPLRAHEDILVFYDKLPNYDPQWFTRDAARTPAAPRRNEPSTTTTTSRTRQSSIRKGFSTPGRSWSSLDPSCPGARATRHRSR